jgi:hypothetical protein
LISDSTFFRLLRNPSGRAARVPARLLAPAQLLEFFSDAVFGGKFKSITFCSPLFNLLESYFPAFI